MSDTRKIICLYNSRNTIIELLLNLNYVVSDYQDFSINEIDAMKRSDQLDMLLRHATLKKKVYVKYHLPEKQKQISKLVLDDIIEDLFYAADNILSKDDTLIIIMDEEPNDSNISKMNYLYDHDKVFIVMHNIRRLQFNILKHNLVPKMTILNESEAEILMTTKKITNLSQLPEISRYDPQALAICLRPKEICKIERDSMTALTCTYYRVCV